MVDRPTFDLQSHSRHSDGALAPGAVVALAAEAGVELLALTDHDSVDGVEEAAAAAQRLGVALVPAVEISAVEGDESDLHVLGYLVDPRDRALARYLASYRADRERRAGAMAAALRDLGWELDDALLERRAAEGQAIGRPHLAEAVVGHPANAGKLRGRGLADPGEFLVAHLVKGKPAFRPRTHPTVPEAIEVIHAAGGLAVWAHPFWDLAEVAYVVATIDRFRAAGLDGVECFYTTHTREQTDALVRHCSDCGLLMTGSSDFHGPRHRHFSSFRAFSTFGHTPELGPIGR